MKLVKKADDFGQPVSLNMNKQQKVNTYVGGILSILMQLAVKTYLLYKLYVMFKFKSDSISSNDTLTDFETLGSKTMKDLNILIYYQFVRT